MHVPQVKYPCDPADGRENLKAGNQVHRMLRGGSFGSTYDRARLTYRGALEPAGSWRGDGFRIVVARCSTDSTACRFC